MADELENTTQNQNELIEKPATIEPEKEKLDIDALIAIRLKEPATADSVGISTNDRALKTFKKFLEKFVAMNAPEIHVKVSDFKRDEQGKTIPTKNIVGAIEMIRDDSAYCKKNKIKITLHDAKMKDGKEITRYSRLIDIERITK